MFSAWKFQRELIFLAIASLYILLISSILGIMTLGRSWIQQRFVFTALGFLAIMNSFMIRICLSMAIVKMVAVSSNFNSERTTDDTCSSLERIASNVNSTGTYEWDEETQGIILGSFYWGYMITHVPGGIAAQKFGGKYTAGLGVLSSAILALLTPTIVEYYNATGLMLLRFAMGLTQGCAIPAMALLIAKWAPPRELSMIGSVVYAGCPIGIALTTSLAGVIMEYSYMGWTLVFYVVGTSGIVWFLLWIPFCHETPDQHPFILKEESEYLRDAMSDHSHERVLDIPWGHILRSKPVWALAIGLTGHYWGVYLLFTDLPKYMDSILKFSIETNGLSTSISYVCWGFSSISSSILVNWIISKGKMSRTNARKLFSTVATVSSGGLMVAASYAACDRTMVVVLIALAMMIMGLFTPGMQVNAMDLSPNYSGVLMGMTHGFACLSGIVAPYTAGILTPNQTLSEWRLVFWIIFVIFVATSIIFVLWGDGEVQYWNDPNFRKHLPKCKFDGGITHDSNDNPTCCSG